MSFLPPRSVPPYHLDVRMSGQGGKSARGELRRISEKYTEIRFEPDADLSVSVMERQGWAPADSVVITLTEATEVAGELACRMPRLRGEMC